MKFPQCVLSLFFLLMAEAQKTLQLPHHVCSVSQLAGCSCWLQLAPGSGGWALLPHTVLELHPMFLLPSSPVLAELLVSGLEAAVWEGFFLEISPRECSFSPSDFMCGKACIAPHVHLLFRFWVTCSCEIMYWYKSIIGITVATCCQAVLSMWQPFDLEKSWHCKFRKPFITDNYTFCQNQFCS